MIPDKNGLPDWPTVTISNSSNRWWWEDTSHWSLYDRTSGHPLCMEREVAHGMKIDFTLLGGNVLPLLHTSAVTDWHGVLKTAHLCLKMWLNLWWNLCFRLFSEVTLKLVLEITLLAFPPALSCFSHSPCKTTQTKFPSQALLAGNLI